MIFRETERIFLTALADKIAKAPEDADGAWFHQAIYEFKDSSGLTPKELFATLYRALIGKESGPTGWLVSESFATRLVDQTPTTRA